MNSYCQECGMSGCICDIPSQDTFCKTCGLIRCLCTNPTPEAGNLSSICTCGGCLCNNKNKDIAITKQSEILSTMLSECLKDITDKHKLEVQTRMVNWLLDNNYRFTKI